ncbi:cyclase family protein [Micrococcales bacterium 31B]|nr:cyclase family protein [Micrococcales bacterium 31B]
MCTAPTPHPTTGPTPPSPATGASAPPTGEPEVLPGGLGGPAVTVEDFDERFDRLQRWGQYTNPSAGAWQRVTPAQITAAAALVTAGEVVTMSLPWNTVSGPDNHSPALHYMTDLGDREAPEPSCHKDFIGADYHGKAVSHLDALAHIAYRGTLFNDTPARDVVGSTGARFGDVAALGTLVTRGVLLDFPELFGVPWLEPGRALTARDIEAAESRLGVTLGAGDAVLIRSGHFRRRAEVGVWDPSNLSAGLHVGAMDLLAERDIVCLGGDGDSDVRPSPVPGVHSPIHVLAITALGIPLLDNLHLEALSQACARHQRYAFHFTVAPLNIPAGTGSPVSPVAVF